MEVFEEIPDASQTRLVRAPSCEAGKPAAMLAAIANYLGLWPVAPRLKRARSLSGEGEGDLSRSAAPPATRARSAVDDDDAAAAVAARAAAASLAAYRTLRDSCDAASNLLSAQCRAKTTPTKSPTAIALLVTEELAAERGVAAEAALTHFLAPAPSPLTDINHFSLAALRGSYGGLGSRSAFAGAGAGFADFRAGFGTAFVASPSASASVSESASASASALLPPPPPLPLPLRSLDERIAAAKRVLADAAEPAETFNAYIARLIAAGATPDVLAAPASALRGAFAGCGTGAANTFRPTPHRHRPLPPPVLEAGSTYLLGGIALTNLIMNGLCAAETLLPPPLALVQNLVPFFSTPNRGFATGVAVAATTEAASAAPVPAPAPAPVPFPAAASAAVAAVVDNWDDEVIEILDDDEEKEEEESWSGEEESIISALESREKNSSIQEFDDDDAATATKNASAAADVDDVVELLGESDDSADSAAEAIQAQAEAIDRAYVAPSAEHIIVSGLPLADATRLANSLHPRGPRGVSVSGGAQGVLAPPGWVPSRVVAKYGRESISSSQLQCLADGEWLNDAVVNTELRRLQAMNVITSAARGGAQGGRAQVARVGPHGAISNPSVWIASSFLLTELTRGGVYDASRVARWSAASADLSAYDVLLFPVHCGTHWALAALDQGARAGHWWDSLAPAAGASPAAGAALDTAQRWMADRSGLSRAGAGAGDGDGAGGRGRGRGRGRGEGGAWGRFLHAQIDVPQQENGSDCGVFMLALARCLSLGKMSWDFSQIDIPLLRRRMALDLIATVVTE